MSRRNHLARNQFAFNSRNHHLANQSRWERIRSPKVGYQHGQQRDRSRNKKQATYEYHGQNRDEHKGQAKFIPEVEAMEIGKPKVYLLWKHSKEDLHKPQQRQRALLKSIHVEGNPPLKDQPASSKVSQLKNQITPVENIWSSLIKQYLNDSEFVEISRKQNSLQYGKVAYGKTMIKYQGLQGNSSNRFYSNKSTQYNIFSRAYFKLWEILSLGILNSKKDQDITIANLAEGPGGFLHALVDYRLNQNSTLQDRYYAITLRIQEGKTRNAKDWSDYRAKQLFQRLNQEKIAKIQLSYGQSGDGDLLKIQNIDSFKTHIMEGRSAFLVTGDGGIECIGDDEFHYQQIFNTKLFFAEVVTALKIQQIGGVFVLKIYDTHFQITKQILILLSLFYRKVGIVKPLTSRPGNSEKYVLCEQFLGIAKERLALLEQILVEWVQTQQKLSYFENKSFLHTILSFGPQLSEQEATMRKRIQLINQVIAEEQEKKLEKGLELINRHGGNRQKIKEEIVQNRYKEQLSFAFAWCNKYGLPAVEVNLLDQRQ